MRSRRSVILCCIGLAILAAVPRARSATGLRLLAPVVTGPRQSLVLGLPDQNHRDYAKSAAGRW